jgi:hypothetical protein
MRAAAVALVGLMLLRAGCEPSDDVALGTTERCEDQVKPATCLDFIGGAANTQCAWVDVRSSDGTCEGGTRAGQCVTLLQQDQRDAGCPEQHVCGEQQGPFAYVRNAGEAGVQTFVSWDCEYQPDPAEWELCSWDDPDSPPHEACTCLCERCEEQLTQSACDDLVAPDESWFCEWVDVWTSPGSCEEGTTKTQCVTFNSPGAGCGGSFACNDQFDARTFIRDAGEAGVQVIQAETCGLDPEWGVWEQCQWDEMGNVTPHPACACGC